MDESEKFHRPKSPPSFEYFTRGAIGFGNEKIQKAFAFLENLGYPTFNIDDYLKEEK